MATFTVTNTNDSGAGSLRQAILDANANPGADIIQFSIVSGSTITLTSGELQITDSVSIDGDLDNNGTADITIERSSTAPAFRIFNINDGNNSTFSNVTIDGLVIRGGSATVSGGGIYNRENLTIRNSTIGGNTARNDGGGIFNFYNATVSISNSTIGGNTAGDDGGGIYNRQATANISNSTIGGNSANFRGGGIYNRQATASISNSTIEGNTATSSGGIFNRQATASISNSTIGGNSAVVGGGIYNSFSATASISNSTIGGNTAGSLGGGIFNYNSTASISNSRISDNTATNRSGGLLVQSGSVSSVSTTFVDNSGIGIDLQGGIEDSNFVTANDLGDSDAGANGLQNFPVLSISGGNVTATLNSTPNTNFLLQLFSNTAPDLSGFGEGETLVASQNVITDASGNVAFTFLAPSGSNFAATATRLDAGNNPIETSEFSAVLDTTPPTVTTIDDGDADNIVIVGTTLTYTVTFSEDIQDGTVTATDFDNAGTATITIGAVNETSPGVFTVEVTPTTIGTLQLRIPTGAIVSDLAGNNLVVPVLDDDTLTVNPVPDTTPPTVTTIDDGDADNTVIVGTTLTYTITFSEDILNGSVTAVDFDNAGTANITIGAITETSPGVFTVQVTPTTAGTLQLRIPTGAVISDLANNNLVVPVLDDDTINVTITAIPAVNLLINTINASEGSVITLTVTSSAPVVGNQGVSLFLTGSVSSADFTSPIPTTIPIANGSTTGAVSFTIADDTVI